MAYKSLKAIGLSFDLVRSEDIRRGILKNYRMLFVPGGWASNKLKALGDKGAEEIKRFVYEGGNYFGICGGAGLATMDGLGLLNIKRKPTKQRVPSFSGRIYLNISEHPIFTSSPIHQFTNSPVFHAWWPSQFMVNDKDIKILATFQEALPDSYSSDLNVGDVRKNGNWKELEELYGINLDPERLKDEPAVVEGSFGKGKVLLSLIHFDTPEDENGAVVLRNIWEYLGGSLLRQSHGRSVALSATVLQCGSATVYKGLRLKAIGLRRNFSLQPNFFSLQPSAYSVALSHYCSEIIDFGIRNFLWFWRTPMLLQWRRGVRGLEYNTLYVMAKEITEADHSATERQSNSPTSCRTTVERSSVSHLNPEDFFIFKEKALRLLMLERKAMQRGVITYEYSDDPEIQSLRKELFGSSKSYGGQFKELLDQIDYLLYHELV
ncbi:MAG: BPL-N domain-containing protein [Thermodesulfovibrionales bacterium]